MASSSRSYNKIKDSSKRNTKFKTALASFVRKCLPVNPIRIRLLPFPIDLHREKPTKLTQVVVLLINLVLCGWSHGWESRLRFTLLLMAMRYLHT